MEITKKSLFYSTIVAIPVFSITTILTAIYYDFLWTGPSSSMTGTGVRWTDSLSVLAGWVVFLVLFNWVKYFLFDLAGRNRISKINKKWATGLFVTIYSLGVLMDIQLIFLMLKPVVGAGDIILTIIFGTPVVLFWGIVVLTVVQSIYSRYVRKTSTSDQPS